MRAERPSSAPKRSGSGRASRAGGSDALRRFFGSEHAVQPGLEAAQDLFAVHAYFSLKTANQGPGPVSFLSGVRAGSKETRGASGSAESNM